MASPLRSARDCPRERFVSSNAAPDGGTVPASLKPPETQTLSLEARATGVQIYTCGASKTDPTRFEWVFKAPEADLFDSEGQEDRQALRRPDLGIE